MKPRLITTATMTILILGSILAAADAQTNSSTGQDAAAFSGPFMKTRQVIASASANSLRFSSLGELTQMRLEVIGSSGDVLFDSGFKQGNLLDWPLTNNQGQRLADGAYLCIVGVKDPSTPLNRRQAVVTLREQSVSLKQADSSFLTAAQVQAVAPVTGEDVLMTIVEPAESAATALLAHDGTTAQLISGSGGLLVGSGDFFANKVLEHVRITAEGNVGIGTRTPEFRLDVDGLIRASRGIVYPDGTIQLSAASRTLGASSLRADQARKLGSKHGQENFEPQTSGTGTQNHLARWSDNAGTLGDSAIVDVSGDIGIGTNTPQSGLDYRKGSAAFFTRDFPTNPGNAVSALQLGLSNVGSRNVNVGPSFLFFGENTAGAKSFLGRVSGVWENPTAGGEAGAIFFQVRANSADVNALTERMRITSGGNVGIGTGSPDRNLTVQRSGGAFINARDPSGPFEALLGADSNGGIVSTMTNHDLQLRAGGNSTKVIIKASGNVGIGTTTPGFKLDVADRIRLRQGASGAAGLWFFQTTPNNDRAFVGMFDDTHVGLYGNNGAGWGLLMDTTNANLYSNAGLSIDGANLNNGGINPGIAFGSFGSGEGIGSKRTAGGDQYGLDFYTGFGNRMSITNGGNIGMGTTSPLTQLHIRKDAVGALGPSITLMNGSGGANAGASIDFDGYDTGNNEPTARIRSFDDGNSSSYLSFQIKTPGSPTNSLTAPLAIFHDKVQIIGDSIVTGTSTVNLAGGGSTPVCRNGNSELATCGSSLRYKEHVKPYDAGLDVLRKLQPVTYTWKDSGQRDLGLVAEQVHAVYPLLSTYNATGQVEGVKYDRLPVLLINAVQQQQEQIKQQQEQIKRQQEEIKQHRALVRGQQHELEALKRLVCLSHPRAKACQ